jgi:lambda family phage portal protein
MFAGAKASRLTEDWITRPTATDEKIRQSLRRLRDRSRQLEGDNPHAARFVQLGQTNIVGPKGMILQMRARNARGELYRSLNAQVEAAWHDWCRPTYASASGRHSWRNLLALAVRGWFVDGEFLAVYRTRKDNPYKLTLQVLDPDQLDLDYTEEGRRNRPDIVMGVEYDADRRPLAYHIWDGHPANTVTRGERRRYLASDVIHSFLPKYPGQTRGVPAFAPIMLPLRHLDGYVEAELVAARSGAAKPVYITPGEDAIDLLGDSGTDSIRQEIEPGMVDILPKGYTVTGLDPTHPNSAFSGFVTANLRSIASGLGISYTSLTGDLTSANYSSARVGLLDERDHWRTLQAVLVEQVIQPVFDRWLALAAASGKIPAQAGREDMATYATWQSRGWQWVDPLKDVQALKEAIALGVASRSDACAERGADFEDTLEKLEAEEGLAKEYGVSITPPEGAAPNGQADEAEENGSAGDVPDDADPAARGAGGRRGRRADAAARPVAQ